METTLNQQDPSLLVGRKFKFTISSAEEAVDMIRKHLGDKARVLSVNQVGGKGFARFISSPKLEVIATIPPESIEMVSDEPATPDIVEEIVDRQKDQLESSASKPILADVSSKMSTLEVLRKSGFSDSLMMQIENSPSWEKTAKEPLSRGIAEFSKWLSREFNKIKSAPITNRIAFLGTPGAGKTMTLCKILSRDVFLHSKTVKVLKLESDTPNSSDILSIFCDTLGIELIRDPNGMKEVSPNEITYLDLPGVNTNDSKGWQATSEQLDALGIDTRILVINAAYHDHIIRMMLEAGLKAKVTHLVFTHVDELTSTTRLWNFILQSGIPTLYFSYGQNMTGDLSGDILQYLNGKTFSSILNALE